MEEKYKFIDFHQNDPLKYTKHVHVLYVITVEIGINLLYVKFYEWLFYNLCI